LPLDVLNNIDATLHYDLAQLIVRGIRIDNIEMVMEQKGGLLSIKPLVLDVAGGKIEAHFTLEAAGPARMKLDATVDSLSYDQLFRMIGSEEYARGTANAELDLAGEGGTVRALMSGLNGKLRITTVDGVLNSSAMRYLGQDVASLIPFNEDMDRQKIQCGVVAFDVSDGVAEARALVFNTGVVSAVGKGNINLKTEKLDLYVEPRTRRTSVLKIAMVPVNIKGTIVEPAVIPDTAGTAVSTTKTAAHIGLAVMTSGISLAAEGLTEKLWASVVDETDYCALALSGEKVSPANLIKSVTGGGDAKPDVVPDEETTDSDLFDDDLFDDYGGF
jgi:uncharacterized protein involved in outer membrane biogenesis